MSGRDRGLLVPVVAAVLGLVLLAATVVAAGLFGLCGIGNEPVDCSPYHAASYASMAMGVVVLVGMVTGGVLRSARIVALTAAAWVVWAAAIYAFAW